MNKIRRKRILEIKEVILREKDKLQFLLDEEQDYYDNMPENLQGSVRGSDSEDAIDTLEECIEVLEEVVDKLSDF